MIPPKPLRVSQSLPSRERELKRSRLYDMYESALSLPSRERELKLQNRTTSTRGELSLPSRERELKLLGLWHKAENGGRSPRGSVN